MFMKNPSFETIQDVWRTSMIIETEPHACIETGTHATLFFKVIPLKLFYYQTFFETWRNEHS